MIFIPKIYIFTNRPLPAVVQPCFFHSIERPRLRGNTTETLCHHVCHGKSLPPEVRSEINFKTDSVPVLVEVLTQVLLEGSLAHLGDETALERQRQAILQIRQIGFCYHSLCFYSILASACLKSGNRAAAQTALDEAFLNHEKTRRRRLPGGAAPAAGRVFAGGK